MKLLLNRIATRGMIAVVIAMGISFFNPADAQVKKQPAKKINTKKVNSDSILVPPPPPPPMERVKKTKTKLKFTPAKMVKDTTN